MKNSIRITVIVCFLMLVSCASNKVKTAQSNSQVPGTDRNTCLDQCYEPLTFSASKPPPKKINIKYIKDPSGEENRVIPIPVMEKPEQDEQETTTEPLDREERRRRNGYKEGQVGIALRL